MATLIDLTGKRFGRLVVLSQAGKDRSGNIKWLAQCDCGRTATLIGGNLRKGLSASCGCLRKEASAERMREVGSIITHGLSRTPHYKRWANIVRRTTDPNDKDYKQYGARGIAMWDEWRNDVAAFVSYLDDVLGPCPKGQSLDRIDNDGSYEPGNLRWADRSTQSINRRDPWVTRRSQRRLPE